MSLASLITPLLWAEVLAHEPFCQIYPKQELRTLLVQSSLIICFVLFVCLIFVNNYKGHSGGTSLFLCSCVERRNFHTPNNYFL